MSGGELFVPRIPSMRLLDLAKAISPKSEIIEIGMRPGEKLHEEMISADDSNRTLLINKKRMVVLPVIAEWGFSRPNGEPLPADKPYRSDTNSDWVEIKYIRNFIEAERENLT
jgi:UDP-N-acetylglucosamine 4,6-dehydratase